MGPKADDPRAFALATSRRAVIGALDQIEAMLASTQVCQAATDATT